MFMDNAYKFFGYSISYTVLYLPWLFCDYLFVLLNPLTSSSILPHPCPIWQPSNTLHIHDSVPVFLVWFLDSIADRYIFIEILLFIILILFFFISPFNISYNNGLVRMNSFSFFFCLGSSLSALWFLMIALFSRAVLTIGHLFS